MVIIELKLPIGLVEYGNDWFEFRIFIQNTLPIIAAGGARGIQTLMHIGFVSRGFQF